MARVLTVQVSRSDASGVKVIVKIEENDLVTTWSTKAFESNITEVTKEAMSKAKAAHAALALGASNG